jgi:DNA polymerase-3 subunit beta
MVVSLTIAAYCRKIRISTWAGCDILKQAFARAAILSNEKFRGVRLYVSENQLKITANNPEQEEAEEILDVTYAGTEMEIGFNVSYVLDVLNALKCENVRILLTDSVSSVQIEDAASNPQPMSSCL